MRFKVPWPYHVLLVENLTSALPSVAEWAPSCACANESPVPPHPSQDPDSEATADNSPEAVRAESHTDTAQTWPPQKTQNMVGDDNIQRRIHAFCIMQAATDADLTSH